MFDLFELLPLATKSRSALLAENLFLRKQLSMFQERNIRPQRFRILYVLVNWAGVASCTSM